MQEVSDFVHKELIAFQQLSIALLGNAMINQRAAQHWFKFKKNEQEGKLEMKSKQHVS